MTATPSCASTVSANTGYVTLADAIAVAPVAGARAARGGPGSPRWRRGTAPVLLARRLPGVHRGRLTEPAGGARRLPAAAFLVSDENVLRAQGGGLLRGAPRITIAPGERSKTLREAEAVWGAMVEAAGLARGPDRRARRRRRRRPRGLLCRLLPAGNPSRPSADEPCRASRFGLRRKDRRRPRARQELRRCLPPAAGGARRPGPARDPAGRREVVPAGPR